MSECRTAPNSEPKSSTASRTATSSPTGSSGPRRAACCARSAWATTTGASRRSASPSSWNEITPCNLSLDRLAKPAKEGVHGADGFPLEFGTISVSDGISMGHERDALLAGVSARSSPTRSRRCSAPSNSTAAVLLAGCDKSLPGHADGRRAAGRRRGVPLRRVDPARASWTARRHDHRRLRGGRRVPGRPDHPRSGGRDRAGDLPRRGRLRWHVHREHDGQRRRGAGHVAAGQRGAAGRRTAAATGTRERSGEAVVELVDAGHHRPRHPDQGGLRERDRRGHGARRIDERRAAPAGDRPRGRGRARPRRLQPDRRPGAAPGRRQAVRPAT